MQLEEHFSAELSLQNSRFLYKNTQLKVVDLYLEFIYTLI